MASHDITIKSIQQGTAFCHSDWLWINWDQKCYQTHNTERTWPPVTTISLDQCRKCWVGWNLHLIQWHRSQGRGEGGDHSIPPNKNIGAKVSFCHLKVLAIFWTDIPRMCLRLLWSLQHSPDPLAAMPVDKLVLSHENAWALTISQTYRHIQETKPIH